MGPIGLSGAPRGQRQGDQDGHPQANIGAATAWTAVKQLRCLRIVVIFLPKPYTLLDGNGRGIVNESAASVQLRIGSSLDDIGPDVLRSGTCSSPARPPV